MGLFLEAGAEPEGKENAGEEAGQISHQFAESDDEKRKSHWGALLRSVSVNLAELSPSPRLRRTHRRVLEIERPLRRSVSVNPAELSPSPGRRRTRWRVFEMKGFWFMGNMVTDRVGHWWVEEGYLLGWRGGVGLIHGSSHSAVAGVAVVPAVFGSGDR